MNLGILIVIVLYLVGMFGIAAWLRTRVKSDDDYLLAGRKMGTVLTATMLLAINFGGAFVLGTSQDAYAVGFAAISFAIGVCAGLCLLAVFVAKPMRNGGFTTVPGFLGSRYRSRGLQLLLSALSVIALLGILAGQVGAAASAFGALGLGQPWGAVVGMVLIIVFTVVSGMWGVAITDFIQFCVIVVGMVLVAVIAVQAAGGLGAITEAFHSAGVEQSFNPLNQGWSFFLGAALPVVVHKMVGQDVMQRVFAAKSGRVAAGGAALAGVLTALFAVVPALAGMAAKVLFPDLDPSVGAVPALIENVLPVWAAGILIAAIISAVMSTADALLLAAVSNISQDFLLKVRSIRESPRRQLVWSQALTVVLGFVALGISLVVPGIIQVLTMAFTMYGSGVFVSFVFGLFTPFGGKWASLLSVVAGGAVAALGVTGVLVVGGLPAIVPAIAASLVVYVLTALIAGETRAGAGWKQELEAKQEADVAA
ncbi:sodium:solute symporter [Gulosibacter sp. 10]|uniref:sodium:solute symporter family protein n=1 Tax=Gulosibacter sp. 10 TaxID=1255570 RepID=UPI00097F6724|nr:sodium:solute symporter family protein [Gulosibacter sp. 10]SJM71416.1 sodium-solute symporter, putative [Gulosibacter sp. 10]